MDQNTNISPEVFEQIEQYLLGQMPAAEQQAFEEKIENDLQLKGSVQQMQLIILGVQETALISKLNRFHEEMPVIKKEPVKVVRLFSARRLLAAACVFFVLAVGAWFLLFKKSPDEKLYTTYFQPDPGLMTTMGTTDNYTFDRAMVDYKTGNYTQAITAWKSLLQTAPQNDTLNYFIGSALLANEQPKDAIPYLQKVTIRSQSFFLSDAYWYLGLALLKEGKKEEAIVAIQRSNHPQKEKLLGALN